MVSIACSKPPEGRCQWTLSLLTDELIALTEGEPVSKETVRRRLKDNELKPWQKKMLMQSFSHTIPTSSAQ